eukprot:CAMPEP_0201513798 /NCGR_PEP_ID=MMETSP0161_2-20130828/5782_1 /ASSEMBLY_ACC=CAM_ASM_000251 /TAXON_ID=180227 /ORGANISM="Neoparamoeba aestuarina, Strain SoJaBio B1-5/56/2" /LENGTH=58 /DNA_ID=CAMNT_0047910147 /DNA_START=127 /DNA_END=303 /DNA_ORIENTATION=-
MASWTSSAEGFGWEGTGEERTEEVEEEGGRDGEVGGSREGGEVEDGSDTCPLTFFGGM